MSVNLRELAKMLELSPTTVSRALAGYPDVSSKTRSRVLEAGNKFDYFLKIQNYSEGENKNLFSKF